MLFLVQPKGVVVLMERPTTPPLGTYARDWWVVHAQEPYEAEQLRHALLHPEHPEHQRARARVIDMHSIDEAMDEVRAAGARRREATGPQSTQRWHWRPDRDWD